MKVPFIFPLLRLRLHLLALHPPLGPGGHRRGHLRLAPPGARGDQRVFRVRRRAEVRGRRRRPGQRGRERHRQVPGRGAVGDAGAVAAVRQL